MALKQIPQEKKEAYNITVKDLREKVDAVQKRAQKFEREGMRDKETVSFYKRIAASNNYLETVKIYSKMNEYSIQIMEIKNDLYLTNARKNIYQAIKMLETIVGPVIDSSLTDNAEVVEKLSLLNPKRVYNLLKKIDYSIALIQLAEGETSKWKWTFVEMYGKLAALSKNFTDFKVYAQQIYDPTTPFYKEINDLIQFTKKSIESAAQKYRTKYELSTLQVQDMNKGIEFLNLLLRIYIILNEQIQAQDTKKTIEKWKDKLEQDIRKKDAEVKKQQKEAISRKK
jgi:hypothetical protein